MGFFTQTICWDHKYRTRCNDNERPHRENTVNQYPAIEADTIEKMQRLSKSLDLNPMKHVWDVLMRQNQQLGRAPINTKDLKV